MQDYSPRNHWVLESYAESWKLSITTSVLAVFITKAYFILHSIYTIKSSNEQDFKEEDFLLGGQVRARDQKFEMNFSQKVVQCLKLQSQLEEVRETEQDMKMLFEIVFQLVWRWNCGDELQKVDSD